MGVSMSEPKQPSWANPVSSRSTISTLGAPSGAFGTVVNDGVDSLIDRRMWGWLIPRTLGQRLAGARPSPTCPGARAGSGLEQGPTNSSTQGDAMALADDAVIIEVGLNEGAGRGINPHVPIGPDEVAADALRCRDAGATMVHWHARDPQSEDQRLGDTDLYAAALAPMREAGLLGYPSYPVDGVLPRNRLDHVWALHERVGLELAPIDLGSVSTVPWNSAPQRLRRPRLAPHAVGRRRQPADVRGRRGGDGRRSGDGLHVRRVRRRLQPDPERCCTSSGRITRPVVHKIFLSEGWAVGPEAVGGGARPPPRAAARRPRRRVDRGALLAPRPDRGRAAVPLRARARRPRPGRHRRQPRGQPAATNAELVEQVVTWAADAGRPVATPEQVRARFGL